MFHMAAIAVLISTRDTLLTPCIVGTSAIAQHLSSVQERRREEPMQDGGEGARPSVSSVSSHLQANQLP